MNKWMRRILAVVATLGFVFLGPVVCWLTNIREPTATAISTLLGLFGGVIGFVIWMGYGD